MTEQENEPAQRITDRRIQTVCLMVLAGVAGIYLVYWLRPVLVPFIVACFIVSGIGPILSYLENRFNVSRVVAAGMAFLFGVIMMAVFGLTISFSIIDLAKNKADYRDRVKQLVNTVDQSLSFDFLKSENFTRKDKADKDEANADKADEGLVGDQAERDESDNGNVQSQETEEAVSPEGNRSCSPGWKRCSDPSGWRGCLWSSSSRLFEKGEPRHQAPRFRQGIVGADRWR